MAKVKLGSTNIISDRNGFGALPIQRVDKEVAKKILLKALEGGITFYDTSRAYSDSEEKLGYAFEGLRDKIVLATKTPANTPKQFFEDLGMSLEKLKTNYIDIYQFHIPSVCYKPRDGTGMYECMIKAKEEGKIRHIGFTNHKLSLAHECIDSKLYETLQFPLSYLSTQKEIELVEKCKNSNMGYIAMKALAGGLITNSEAAYAYMTKYDHVLPIWGIQRESELDEFLSYIDNPPKLDENIKEFIEKEKEELSGDFCRGCGYCMPCPEGISISTSARIALLLKRAPSKNFLTKEAQEMMAKVGECTKCGQCIDKCPYELDIPNLLRRNYEEYKEIVAKEYKKNDTLYRLK